MCIHTMFSIWSHGWCRMHGTEECVCIKYSSKVYLLLNLRFIQIKAYVFIQILQFDHMVVCILIFPCDIALVNATFMTLSIMCYYVTCCSLNNGYLLCATKLHAFALLIFMLWFNQWVFIVCYGINSRISSCAPIIWCCLALEHEKWGNV